MPEATVPSSNRLNSFNARDTLDVGGESHTMYRLDRAAEALGADLDRLPFTHRILLENPAPLRGRRVRHARSDRGARELDAGAEPDIEIAFRPGRVVLQDFTGVPAVVDLAAMRDAMPRWAGILRRSTRCSRSTS